MSNYTKSTNFATKDNLPTGDPLKIVKGTEIDTEYNNIATAIATKTDNSAAAITGGTIVGITDLAIADGGTGASTATAALNNLLPSQTSAANKYLQSDGTNASWDAVTLSTSDITGTLAVANGGTGVTSSTGTGSVVLSNSPTLVTPALGTPASGVATNLTGLPISTGVSGLGTGVASALSVNTGQNNAVVLFNGALGTPSSGNVSNLTGTASININGTVGAVGPASGSFTTLTSSSTVTINGGTANGIGYLNGSKVFTTGTVLKFDGTNITSDRSVGTVYSGTSFATWTNGIVLNNSATPATGLLNSLYFTNNANMQNVFGVAQNASGYGDFVWAGYSGSYAETMRLTSAGLSITGTLSASSTATLNTLSSSGATLTGGTINGMTVGATTASTGAFTTVAASSTVTLSGGTANGVTYLNGSKVLTSGSALVFDGNNLGVGVTPSAWQSGTTVFQMNAASLWARGATNGTELVTNGYFNGTSFIYTNTGTAIRYRQGSGAHEWYSAASGTGGTAISFTQAMTLDASGNLMVGTTSASGKLHVAGTGSVTGLIQSTNGGTVNLSLLSSGVYQWTMSADTSFRWSIDGSEKIRIDSSGNLLVGTTSAVSGGGVLQVSNGITFPATQSASSNANTLDDYEEGTWTPVATPTGGSLTAYASGGSYTRIGRVVNLHGYITITTPGTASGYLQFSGLPFASINGGTSATGQTIGTSREAAVTGVVYSSLIGNSSSSGNVQSTAGGNILWVATYTYVFDLTYMSVP